MNGFRTESNIFKYAFFSGHMCIPHLANRSFKFGFCNESLQCQRIRLSSADFIHKPRSVPSRQPARCDSLKTKERKSYTKSWTSCSKRSQKLAKISLQSDLESPKVLYTIPNKTDPMRLTMFVNLRIEKCCHSFHWLICQEYFCLLLICQHEGIITPGENNSFAMHGFCSRAPNEGRHSFISIPRQ